MGDPGETARTATPVTALWMAHAVLRAVLLVAVLPYGWSKVFLGQMGRLD